jgi:hypothetical protein
MASFPADPGTNTAFVLQELIACWNQAYEALGRGELDTIGELLDHTDALLLRLPDHTHDGPPERDLRDRAVAARGRLEHGMKAGLEGLEAELARTRQGAKTLSGYRVASGATSHHVHRSI